MSTGEEHFPLRRIDPELLLEADTEKEQELRRKRRMERLASIMADASQIADAYPLHLESGGKFLRYAFLPAQQERKGLVVSFHGHNAFRQLGPHRPWPDFDILAPWDTFGWQRQGSWFWGDQGNGYVEPIVRQLIEKLREERGGGDWFCMGGSMGGFASLYYGIKYGASGLYVCDPQVDLRLKVRDYGLDDHKNPYGYLRGETMDSLPDILKIARGKDALPPLYLIQQLYDPVNPFLEHGWRLVEIYNEKRGWYGLRISPGIGHKSDPSQDEARYFFNQILEKRPPLVTDFVKVSP